MKIEKLDLIGLIPAAGKGLRLGLPYPKELYPIISEGRYRPVAHFVVNSILSAGVDHIVFVINETKHQLIGYFGSGKRYHANFSYVFQENEPDKKSTSPGLANALCSAYHLIIDKIVIFGMPDTIMKPVNALERALKSFDPYTVDMLLCLFPTNHPEKFGMVEVDTDGKVMKIVDKPKATSLKYMWGCIIWGPRFTETLYKAVWSDDCTDFATIINLGIKKGLNVSSFIFPEGKFEDLGTFEQIIEFRESQESI